MKATDQQQQALLSPYRKSPLPAHVARALQARGVSYARFRHRRRGSK
jgi:hypothetical protein